MSAKHFKSNPGTSPNPSSKLSELRRIILKRIDIETSDPSMKQYKEVIWEILDVEIQLHKNFGWSGVSLMTRSAAVKAQSGSITGLEQEHVLDRAHLWKNMKSAFELNSGQFDPIDFIKKHDRSIVLEASQHKTLTKKNLRVQYNPIIHLHIEKLSDDGIVKPDWLNGKVVRISRNLTSAEVLDWFHNACLPINI